MSIIRTTEVSLAALANESSVILEVEMSEPYEEIVTQDRSGNVVPPFKKQGICFRVIRILKNSEYAAIPDKINVPTENWRRSFSQHLEAYASGVSKSYTIKSYRSSITSFGEAGILFLKAAGNGSFELAAQNAFESKTNTDKIKSMLY